MEGPPARRQDARAHLGVGAWPGDRRRRPELRRPVRLARAGPAGPALRPAGRRRGGLGRRWCPDRPRQRPGRAPVRAPRRSRATRGSRRPDRRATATGRDRAHRAEPERRVRGRSRQDRVRHRSRAVRHRPGPSSEGHAAGRPARHPRAAHPGRPRRPHRPRHRPLRADAPARRGGRGARLPRAELRRRGPDLRPGGADPAGDPVLRRRKPRAQSARRVGMGTYQAAGPGPSARGRGAARVCGAVGSPRACRPPGQLLAAQEMEASFPYEETSTSSARSPRSRTTWRPAGRWTGSSSATSATARPRSRCGPRSRRSRTAGRSPSSSPPRSSPRSTSRPSASASPPSR